MLGAVVVSALFIVPGYFYLVKQTQSTFDRDLERIVGDASRSVNGDDHALLVGPKDVDTELYYQQSARLRNAFRGSDSVGVVYTLRPKGQDFEYVLNPTTLGAAGEDPFRGRSFQQVKASDLPPGAAETLKGGPPRVSSRVLTDQYGIRKAAFAPIRGGMGRIDGLVVVEKDYSSVVAQIKNLQIIAGTAVLVGIFLGFLIAYVLTEASRQKDVERSTNSKTWSFRAYAEGILMIAAALIFMDGISAQISSNEKRSRLEQISETLPVLYAAEESSEKMSQGADEKTPLRTAAQLAQQGEGGLSSLLREAYAAQNSKRPEAAALLVELRGQIKSRINNLSAELSTLTSEQSKLFSKTDRTLLGAIILSVMTFIFMRISSSKDKELSRVLVEKYKTDQDYRRVVENVPVGLLIWKNGQAQYFNSTFQDLLELDQQDDTEASRVEIFANVLDRDRMDLLAQLEECSDSQESMECRFRVMTASRRRRHLVLRGKPIFSNGQFVHLLAFIIDATASVESRMALQQKNEEIKLKNEMLEGALEQIENSLESVVQSLVRAVEAKDPYTAGHSERVMQYSLWIGEELGLGPYEMRMLELGTLVHDIGKIGIPDEILTKPDRLTAEEFAIIKSHPEVGYQILSDIDMFRDCLPIIRWHHEKMDGSGYPDGITSDEIPFLVRISTVADMFDAMTSSRSYREGMTLAKVIDIMEEDVMNSKLDPIVMGALKTVVERHGVIPQSDEARRADKAA